MNLMAERRERMDQLWEWQKGKPDSNLWNLLVKEAMLRFGLSRTTSMEYADLIILKRRTEQEAPLAAT